MTVKVQVFGGLRRYVGSQDGTATVEAEAGLTVAGLVRQIGIDPRYVGLCCVNGTVVPDTTVLREGDEVALFDPVAGG